MTANRNWFLDQRLAWIGECAAIYGFINRSHLIKKFHISMPQASQDINRFIALYPGRLHYNQSLKRYDWKD